MIDLFDHNRIAYESALSMLTESGRAAVVHPTGTGKSFIGFKLAEDNPDASVCWLSPSEYIFKTQIENLKATGVPEQKNVRFFTYAKLMMMDAAGLEEIRPDYIVLDEFHRCGAQMWGGGVQKLLAMYPQAAVLGLSATNIRYLDNQRDMADELFDGNIASEMTLGEAVVRGILAPPTYVISIYSCQNDLERYQSRISGAKNKAVRDAAQKRLDALRRSLENAEGLDAVFRKHITDRQGKYILFCSNVEHLKEVAGHIGEWFGGIDGSPHLYRAYADDPAASLAFAGFKADDSEHLKLLLCIDMLNEGVHIDDIAGVILFRPTVSPIIYKQQIGRALSAGSKKSTVIIDVVNNIENLYSISALQDEMRFAVDYYRGTGDISKVVNSSFTVIDEVRDSRRLFNELEESLSASWKTMYGCAKAYYKKHGNLEVSKRYQTEDGYSLGSWLNTQRLVYAGNIPGVLGQERITQLESIGMRWQNRYDLSWEKYYRALCEYKLKNGNIDIRANYVTDNGLELGKWICNLRQAKNSGRGGYYLTDERIAALGRLGMIWDKLDYQWELNYLACAEYYLKNHDLNIPAGYTTKEGLRVGAWIRRLRKARDGRVKGAQLLSKNQIQRLDAIGMEWQDSFTKQWEYGYAQAKAYYEKHGDINVSVTYVDENGFPLGKWLRRHTEVNGKTGRASIKLTPERKAKLDKLGFKWEKEGSWDRRISACKEYKAEHGDLDISQQYVTADGIWLGKWLYKCRKAHNGEQQSTQCFLTDEQVNELNTLGMDWRMPNEKIWDERYIAVAEMLEKIRQSDNKEAIAAEYPPSHSLRQWLCRQRSLLKRGRLTSEQIQKLNALNTSGALIIRMLPTANEAR